MGRLSKSMTEVDRPQAGGYRTCPP